VYCEASLPGTHLSVEAPGGQFDTSVTTAPECSWTAASNAPWVQVAPQTGQGNVGVTVTVSANPDTRERTGVLVIAGENLLVVQAAAAPPSPACSYTLSPSSADIGKNGGTKTFDVKTTAACSWTASSSEPWITLLAASGTGNGTVRYDVARHTGNSDRTGTITVAGLVFTLTQKK
jgi:hypothetical protein